VAIMTGATKSELEQAMTKDEPKEEAGA
jgi:hypothetical protein